MHKITNKLLLLLITFLLSQAPVPALADKISEYTVKAAFIYNFARFTQWPDDSNELKVCIYGDDPFGAGIDKLNGKTTNGRTIKIVRTRLIKEIKTCHVAFLNIIPPERHLFEQALKKIDGASVLTVSDAANATDFGVMIGLKIDNNKVAFDVNHTVAQASNLEISAKLLRLAKQVN